MPRKTAHASDGVANKRRRLLSEAGLASVGSPLLILPDGLQEMILQFISVADAIQLKMIQGQTQEAFKRSYHINFFVTFSKPERLGGQMKMHLLHALQQTPANNRSVTASIEVPLDWSGRVQAGMLATNLKEALFPSLSTWPGASVVGFTFNKPKGKAEEFKRSLESMEPQYLEIASVNDARALQDMPQDILVRSSLLGLHCAFDLQLASKFNNKPEALCAEFIDWSDFLPSLPVDVKTIGDLNLHPQGLHMWADGMAPASSILNLGMSIYTGRQATWTPAAILHTVLAAFPNLQRLSVNLEFTYGCDSQDEALFQLIQAFVAAHIEVVFCEVVLVKLPSSSKKRDTRLAALGARLKAFVNSPIPDVRAKTSKEMPFMSFKLPAACAFCMPLVAQEAISDALWKAAC